MAKIAFIWSFPKAKEIFPYWRDGLRKALEIIAQTHVVHIYMGEDCFNVPKTYDAYLFWNDSADPVIDSFTVPERKGLCLTTMPSDITRLSKYHIIFCESKPVKRAVRDMGLYGVQAFGTDDEFFSPDGREKTIPFFYPATFSPWKLQRNITHLRNALLCVGTVQPDGQEDLQACLRAGVNVEVGYFDSKDLREFYRMARDVVVPAIHGSERTVLEAMSMDIFPQVNIENVKAYSFVQEFINSHFESPREFVIRKYSAGRYARKLLEGLRI